MGNKITYEDSSTEYYYIRNGQGNITGLFDGSGAEVVKYTYDTWGKLTAIEGTLADTVGVKNPYRYRGYRYDNETGLYYLQSRYYNPEWGRFVNADALLGSMGTLLSHNMFAYCRNNPVNRVDPSGYHDEEGDGPGKGSGGATGSKYKLKDTYFGKKAKIYWDRLWGRSQGGGTSNAIGRDPMDIIQSAQNAGKGNTSIGSATYSEAWDAGWSWVGPNSKIIYNSKGEIIGLSSADNLRAFRIDYKPSWNQYQANFQQNTINDRTGKTIQVFNAHLMITDS